MPRDIPTGATLMTIPRLPLWLLLQYLLFASSPTLAGVGFQEMEIPDPSRGTMQILIWYPSTGEPRLQKLAAYEQRIAQSGRIDGGPLPLVVISHGTGGSAHGHHDTAWALADAGFVVVALTHPGDNYADTRHYARREQLTERPRQVSRVIDYMLGAWPDRRAVDQGRIGIFGFSMGGFTALASLGGRPETSGLVAQCKAMPRKAACLALGGAQDVRRKFGQAALGVVPDPRLKAAFVAAPALPALFLPDGLRDLHKPVELWAAELDELVPLDPDILIVRDGLPVPPARHIEPGAGHYSFLAPCTEAQKDAAHDICADGPGFDRAAFHRRLNAAVVAFFRRNL